jgi:hypothetical protein
MVNQKLVTCYNCGVELGKLESQLTWKQYVVCRSCHENLQPDFICQFCGKQSDLNENVCSLCFKNKLEHSLTSNVWMWAWAVVLLAFFIGYASGCVIGSGLGDMT